MAASGGGGPMAAWKQITQSQRDEAWTVQPPKRCGHGTACVGSKVFFVGGADDQTVHADVFALDASELV